MIITHKALTLQILSWIDEGRLGAEIKTDKEAIVTVKILPGTDLPLS